jgi:effector-binding domain-containing protein
MAHEVTLEEVAPRPTAVVPARTTWAEFPTLWPVLSGEVWACLRAAGIDRGCRNVMLYDDRPSGEIEVEIGVELTRPCPLTGRVVASSLPGGRVARTRHHGPYGGLGEAHAAVLRWCAARDLEPAGPRWEVYGPHSDDPALLWTEVQYIIRGSS